MKIVYDERADILQIQFIPCSVEETTQIAPGLVLDYDEDGRVIGLEIRKASTRVDDPKAIFYTIDNADADKPQPKVNDTR
ncbi:MAG: DUF2283 domain-containing protein [Cyanobacteria bacterium J06626_14]